MHDEEVLIAIVAMVMVFGLPIAWLVLHYLHATARIFFETRLKRDMVARGFTPQQIVQVVHCRPGQPSEYEAHGIPPAKPIRQPALVQ
jgi:hypothetical protein